MATSPGSILILNHPGDELSNAVTAGLNRQEIRTSQFAPDLLGSSQLSLRDDVLFLDGLPVHGMLFRVSPDFTFSSGFATTDQPFCDAELRAVLLAALNLDSLLAINRYDASAWFEGLGWPMWRRTLIRGGIPVAEFKFGYDDSETSHRWHPYTGWESKPAPGPATRKILGTALIEDLPIQKSLMVGRDLVEGRQSPPLYAAVELLATLGVCIAEIVSDLNDNIISVNTLPKVADPQIIDLASRRIAEMFHAHLYRG